VIEGSRSGSGSGFIPLTNGSGSRGPIKKCGSGGSGFGSGSATLVLNIKIFGPEGADDFRSVARSRVGRLMFNMTRKVILTGELCTVGITDILLHHTVQENKAISIFPVIKMPPPPLPPHQKNKIRLKISRFENFRHVSKSRFYNWK
jgi:hypothetical protein